LGARSVAHADGERGAAIGAVHRAALYHGIGMARGGELLDVALGGVGRVTAGAPRLERLVRGGHGDQRQQGHENRAHGASVLSEKTLPPFPRPRRNRPKKVWTGAPLRGGSYLLGNVRSEDSMALLKCPDCGDVSDSTDV